MSNNKKSPEEIRAQKKLEEVHQVVIDITNLAKFLGTEDMHLAGIVYLASIVRRRKRPRFVGVEVHKASRS